MLLEDRLEVSGVYDSGSQISLINSRLVKVKEEKDNVNAAYMRTVNGVKKTDGLITIKIRIFEIEEEMDVYIVENKEFDDFIIGLDMIKKFKLIQNENLKIEQKKKTDIKEPQNNVEKNSRDNRNKDKKIETYSINFNEHIKVEDFRIKIDHLDDQKKTEIEKIIKEYRTVFAKDKYDIGTVKDYEAHIDLLVDKYCSKRPYRCTIEDKIEIEEQISRLLKNNLIEDSYSPFAAPVTLAFKKDENKRSRLCIDFRELNKIIVPQAQPFPLIDDLIIKTRNCKYFTTLDINSAFWSIPLRVEDRNKTGFVTQDGHFQWTCLPFGLKTSPAIFQRILSNILRKHNLTGYAVNYIDDILIYSTSFQEHIIHIRHVLEAIIKEGFRLKFKKCTFASDSVKYLGHIIQNNSVTPLKDNITSIRNFPTPKTQKNIRQFLGKINFYHEYIPKSAIILDPLHKLLRKNEKFVWTEKCENSFKQIKEYLCSQPILEIFDKDLPIKIYTDASLEGIGAILKQTQPDGKDKPVAYFSKKLNDVQKRKKAVYLECLAIKEAVKYWQHWLIGKPFIIYSDHKPLENMNIKVRTDEELGDLTYYLSQYDFTIKYIPGKENLEADCLSRNPVLEPEDNKEEILKIVNLIQIEEIMTDQEKNEAIEKNKEILIHKNKIYYKKIKKQEKIILSEEFSKKLIKQVHEDLCHIGIRQLQKKIGPIYTAKGLTRNIINICKNCEICIKNKSRGQGKFGLMSQLGPATKPFEIMSIDTIGGFGGSRSTKKYLHLLVDHFTRYGFILTSKTQSATDFIKLVKNVLETDEIGMILTDQYPGINSREFKEYLEENNIKLIFTAVNTPFSNGLNERLNQTIVNKIRCKINEKHNKKTWTTVARECIDKYNETEHSVTGFAPKYLLDGTNVTLLPNELKIIKKQEDRWSEDKRLALENTKKSHDYNKKLFNKNRKLYEFNIGDRVYVENGNKLNRKKLDELKIGPFKIVEKISNSIYRINTGNKKAESTLFHITKLQPIRAENETDEEN